MASRKGSSAPMLRAILGKVEANGAELGVIAIRLDASETELKAHGERLGMIAARLGANEAELKAHGAQLREIGARVNGNASLIQGLAARVDANGSAIEGLAARVDANGSAIEGLGVRVDAIGVATDDLRLRVGSMGVLLEDMRSQNRLTIEAVEASRLALEGRIDGLEQGLQRVERDSLVRDSALELGIRELRVEVQQNGLDIRDLAGRVEGLARIEERVAAIERRLS
jgi:hypothetical protein